MSTREGQRRSAQRAVTLLISLQEASVEYGPPYTSLRDLVLQGHLRRVQLGDSRRIWVKRADLEQLIARSTEVA